MADLNVFRPSAVYRLRTDIAGPLDPSIKNVETFGYSAPGKGAARYNRITGTVPLVNRGYIDLGDGTYLALDPEQTLRVTMWGAIGDNATSDDVAIHDAHAFCQSVKPGLYVPLAFPVNDYISTTPVRLVNGMHWYGEGHYNTEFSNRARLRNSSSDMFDMVSTGTSSQRRTSDVLWTGMRFDGSSYTNGHGFIAAQALDATQGILEYSHIERCGLTNFAWGLQLPVTGVRILNNYFNVITQCLYLSGADARIYDNHMGGGVAGTAANACVRLATVALFRFKQNYITGRPQMCVRADSDLYGCIFTENWFDITDWSAVDLNGARGGMFKGNTIHQCGLGVIGTTGTTSATYNSLIRFHNAYDNTFEGNIFYYDPYHDECDRVATANVTLLGEQVIDHKMTSVSRVLCTGQTVGSQNGIYVSGPGAWVRASDMNTSAEVGGTDARFGFIPVTGGLTQANTFWRINTANVVLGTTSISIVKETMPTYGFDGTCHDNVLRNNVYNHGYQRIISVDATSEYPEVFGEDKFPTSNFRWHIRTDLEWGFATSGAGDFFQNITGAATLNQATPWASNVIGALQFATSQAAGSAAIRSGTADLFFGGGVTKFNARLKVQALSTATNTYTDRVGFLNTNSGDPTAGAFFRYTDGVNGGRWEACTVAGGAVNAVDTGITVTAATEYELKIIANSDGSSVKFYLNTFLVATLTGASIPDTSATLFGLGATVTRTVSAGAVNVVAFDLDYMEGECLFNTPRG